MEDIGVSIGGIGFYRVSGLGFPRIWGTLFWVVSLGMYRDITPMMENQMEKNLENEVETWVIKGFIGIRAS